MNNMTCTQKATKIDQKQQNCMLTTSQLPVLCFDTRKLQVTLNGECIQYQKQMLTMQGLTIINSINTNNQSQCGQIIKAQLKVSVQYDTKLNQIKYCQQLSKTLDRASDSYYLSYKKRSALKELQSLSTNGSNLQICEYIVKKIPLKPRCFEAVFKNLQLHKIKLLFENNSFFLQIVKYLCKILFKVNLQNIHMQQMYSSSQFPQFYISLRNENIQQDYTNPNPKTQTIKHPQKKKRNKNKIHITQFQKKVLKIYTDINNNIKLLKLCYQRINLLLSLFTRQNRMSTFLYQLNYKLIIDQLKNSLPRLLNRYKDEQINILCQPIKSYNHLQILTNLILITKTINISQSKSQKSYQILKKLLIQNNIFSIWLKTNIQLISTIRQSCHKLIQFICILCQCQINQNISYITNIYYINQHILNNIIRDQIQWIYQTINYQYQTQQIQKQEHNKAYKVLDNLLNICKITVKQIGSAVNLGRTICKWICDISTMLRPVDLEILTYVCCINNYSRQNVLKYLFAYFRKFIKNMKNNIKYNNNYHNNNNYNNNPHYNNNTGIKSVRQNKHILLQIIQSIRKISQIQTIQFSIDLQLLNDIQIILSTIFPQNITLFDRLNNKKWRGDCLISAYEQMLKNVNIIKSKQKQKQVGFKQAQMQMQIK